MRISDWSSDVCSSDLAPAPLAPRIFPPGSPLFGNRRVAGEFGAQLVDEILVDRHPDAALRFGGELFDQFVAEGGGTRLSARGDALLLDSFRIWALPVVERYDHPAAGARTFLFLYAVFRSRTN